MATIRDELILADRFSDPLRNYTSGLGRAADASRSMAQGARSGAEAVSEAWRGAARDVQSAAAISARNREYVVGVQADTAQALSGSKAALAGAGNSVQQYAAAVAGAENQTNRARMALQLESQVLQLTIEKYGAGSAAAMQQAQAVNQAAGAVEQAALREQAHNAALAEAAGGSREAAKAVDEYRESTNRAASSTNTLIDRVKGLVGAYAGLRGINELMGLSDSVVQTKARLELVDRGDMSTDALRKMIFDSAQRSRGDYANTADMVSKMGIMAGDAFNGPEELVGFSEMLNKMYTVSGTNLAGQKAATLQLQQAMAMGVLRGQEFRSVVQQVPMLVQAVADTLGVSTGEVKKLADEGRITADVVKNAMFSAADSVNAKFETMPMTWAQVWTSMKNQAIIAMEPILGAINWLANHMEQLAPICVATAAAVLFFAAATWVVSGGLKAAMIAAKGFFATLLTNPITWIALAIGVLVAWIYNWVQSVGGLKIAWLMTVDAVLTWWDKLKVAFFANVYFVQGLLDDMSLAFQTVGVSIQNFMGDMKVGVLTILQNMVNGGVDIINGFIDMLNKIPGVAIETIDHVTFATTAAAENEAAKQARGAAMDDAKKALEDAAAGRDASLAQMEREALDNHRWRQMGINAERQLAAASKNDGLDISGMAQDLGDIAGNTGKTAKNTADMADEDLKYLEDVAVRRYETKVNTTSLTPSITVNVKGSADKGVANDIAASITAILAAQAASHTAISYAEVGV